MRYLLCDTDGQLHDRTGTGDRLAIVNEAVGPEGFASVRLRHHGRTASPFVGQLGAFVNDCGLLFPERYPRNVVGSCLLAALGANAQPYAGPVVITGWDESDPADVEICSLSGGLAEAVRDVHASVRMALGLDEGVSGQPTAWVTAVADLAERVHSGPTPEVRVITDPAEVAAELARSAEEATP